MGFIIGVLTLFLVLDCLVLIFLVLLQLPKKEAGAGLAFGGAATDALFGAGSGNVLTKVTKYAAGTFFILAVVLALLQRNFSAPNTSSFEKKLAQPTQTTPGPLTPGPSTPEAAAPATTSTTNVLVVPVTPATNAPAGAPAAPPQK